MNAGAVDHVGTEISVFFSGRHCAVRKALVLAEKAYDVHAETVDSFLAPPGHHIVDFPPHLRVFPVEVRLFSGKQMQVIHTGLRAVFPGGTGEAGAPVVGLPAVPGLLPDIVIPVRIVPGTAALDEPGVFIRSVVDHQVHDNLHAARMSLCQKTVKVLHGAEFVHDRPVVRYIVAVVVIGGLVDRGQPQDIHTEFFQIGQMSSNSVQIPDSVAVAVGKTPGIDLINNGFFPPFSLFHVFIMTSFSGCAALPLRHKQWGEKSSTER